MAPSDDDAGLFTGVEDVPGPASEANSKPDQRAGSAPLAPGGETPAGMAKSALVAWWRDMTINEWHAIALGFVPWFLALVTGSEALLATGIFVVAGAIVPRTSRFRRLSKALRTIIREPWYALGGSLAGWSFGALVLAVYQVLTIVAGAL